MTDISNQRPAQLRRRGGLRLWLPGQPGALMMVLSPAVAGIVVAWAYRGFAWTPWWLLICWLLCYCVQFSAARWFKSHGAHRWMLQPLVYCIVLCAVGLPFVVLHPGILAWAPPFAVLAAISFRASWVRKERSLWSNAAAVSASCLMPMLTFCYGVDTPDIPYLSIPGISLFLTFFMVQFGSVLFVKTMIRERGRRSYIVASWIWHAVMLAWWTFIGNGYLIALAAMLLIRAVALPMIARRRTVRPLAVGITEFVTSTASLILNICALL